MAQSAEELINTVKNKFTRVTDYEAKGIMKTNVSFLKTPLANVLVFYKKPDKLRITNENGISFIPKGSVNINPGVIFYGTSGFDIIDAGIEDKTNLRIIKLLPKDDYSDIVLSTLFIDEKNKLIKKVKTTTKENGSYELEMLYGKYAEYGLADKVIFTFNISEYKLPKGVTFDYDDGSRKSNTSDKSNKEKGRVEITYTGYKINKGITDSVFK